MPTPCLTSMTASSTETCVVPPMTEIDASPVLPALTPVQMAFLVSLLPGPRPTRDCQDAITIGALVRLNLVAWDEPDQPLHGRRKRSTFMLTGAGTQALAAGILHR